MPNVNVNVNRKQKVKPMPITQDRMVKLIDAANISSELFDALKNQIENQLNPQMMAEFNSIIARENNSETKTALQTAVNVFGTIHEILKHYNIPNETRRNIIEEETHFKLSARRNNRSAIVMRAKREKITEIRLENSAPQGPVESERPQGEIKPEIKPEIKSFVQYDETFVAPDDDARGSPQIAEIDDPRKTRAELIAEGYTELQVVEMAKANRSARNLNLPEPYPQMYKTGGAAADDEIQDPKAKGEKLSEKLSEKLDEKPSNRSAAELYSPPPPDFSDRIL
jgi:hypothetical protein